jgi:two-component system response regulator NreC
MIKVLLADDHAILREGLKSLISLDPEFKVVGEANDGLEALEMAGSLKPDVILMDIAMPVMNGMEATKKIKEKYPLIKVLILSQYDSQEYLFNVLQAGASGYVLKRNASGELFWAIKSVHEGLAYLTPAMASLLINNHFKEKEPEPDGKEIFTPREHEVLKLIAEGSTNQEIAEKLIISLKTVQTHRSHIMEKLNLHDRTELIKYALAKGIISV